MRWIRGTARVASVTAFALVIALGVAPTAHGEGEVEFIRTYSSSNGTVFEVCRGTFDPPVTDPLNPAYCRGKPENWTQQRWQAYNKTGRDEPPASQPGKSKAPQTKAPSKPTVAVGAGPTSRPAVPYGGSLDPTSVLGVSNPLCGQRGQLSAAQVRNCQSSRSPESAYPVGNYGWDVHIEEGGFITSLFAPAVAFVLQIFSVFWLLLLLMLKGCLIVLGFTFSLSPFTDNHMLRQIAVGLGSFYNNFTAPWLTALMVILGGWGLYNGMIRRRAGETMGGMLAALAMMLIAMWMIHSPRETVGRVAEIVNKMSLVAVAAPSSGHLRAPIRSYNDAMASVWNQMTAVPWCAMDFSDVRWCLRAKPSREAIEAAKEGLDPDEPFTQALLHDLPEDDDAATRALNRRLSALFGDAPTISSLYLRFSPGSGPRDALWTYYNGKGDDHVGLPFHVGPQINVGGGTEGAAPDKVAMQGRSGVLPRMVLLLLFIVGLLGGLLLILWIALKLVMAAASAFVLVLLAPLAMFFPVFGAAGRAAFIRWGTSLLGAIVAKLVFSALLGVVLLGSTVLGAGVGGSSPTLGLIATMAFWWACLLNRERYVALLQIDPVRDQGTSFYRTLAGGYVGYRVAKAATNAIGRRRSDRADQRRDRQARAGEADLAGQAEQRLDVSIGNAEARDAAYSKAQRDASALRKDGDLQDLHRDRSRLDAAGVRRAEGKAQQLRELEGRLDAGRDRAAADRQMLRKVRANEAQGLPRYGRQEVEAAKEAIRGESMLPAGAPEHRWRAQAAGVNPDSAAGQAVIRDSVAQSQAAAGAASPSRMDQVDLHRLRSISGRRRRAESVLQRAGTSGGSGSRLGPKRRSRARDGLSR